jgi:hypothetical protein
MATLYFCAKLAGDGPLADTIHDECTWFSTDTTNEICNKVWRVGFTCQWVEWGNTTVRLQRIPMSLN